MVVLEAMQMGIPVLFDKLADVGEVVNSCIKIESASIEDISNKFIELLEDEQKWLVKRL
jgi:glycosyltransferase involved in cell wall biosynthesis